MKKINRWIVISLCGAIILSATIGLAVSSRKLEHSRPGSNTVTGLNLAQSKTQITVNTSSISSSGSSGSIKVKATAPTPTIKPNTIETVANYTQIIALLKSNSTNNTTYNTMGAEKSTATIVPGAATANAPTAAGAQTAATVSDSTTNIQVAGVDEADIIEHDGNTIYYVSQGKIFIADITDPTKMKILSTITCLSGKGSPIEAFLYNSKLVVISGYYDAQTQSEDTIPGVVYSGAIKGAAMTPATASTMMPWYGGDTAAIIYDVTNKTAPKMLRSFIQQGAYISSRMVDNYLYLATNRNACYYSNMKDTDLIPSTTDSANKNVAVLVPPDRIIISDYKQYSSFFVVSGLDVNDTTKAADTQALLGWGNNIYATQGSLYVAIPRQDPITPVAPSKSSAVQSQTASSSNTGGGTAVAGTVTTGTATIKPTAIMPQTSYNEDTDIIKFSLDEGKISLIATGNVNGTVLNQYSMDEDSGYFRIATTTGQYEEYNNTNTLKNNLYILDGQMQPVGKLEGMAPGEQIYSVRFMGDRVFLVTFRTVDPLFAIDLSDPKNPKMLGELKIPGYSKYLLPWGSQYILGMGVDADPSTGRSIGMKVALFDVSDLSNPKQISVYNIGDSGTYSAALDNPKALLVMQQAGYIGFPISIYQMSVAQKNDTYAYGQFTFDGYYLLNIDPSKGANAISFRGSVSHLAEQDQSLLYQNGLSYEIQRGIVVNNNLYTVSDGLIKATSTDGSKAIGELALPAPVINNSTVAPASSGSTGTTPSSQASASSVVVNPTTATGAPATAPK